MDKLAKKVCFLLVIAFAFSLSPLRVRANMAEPNHNHQGSGIVFDKNQEIAVTKEIIDIKLSSSEAEVKVEYNLKNVSSMVKDMQSMFLAPVYGGDYGDISVNFGGQELNFTTQYFCNANRSGYTSADIENWQNILASASKNPQPFGDASGYYEYKFTSDNKTSVCLLGFDAKAEVAITNSNQTELSKAGLYIEKYQDYQDDNLILLSRRDGQDISILNGELASVKPIENIYDYVLKYNFQSEEFIEEEVNESAYKLAFDKYLPEIEVNESAYKLAFDKYLTELEVNGDYLINLFDFNYYDYFDYRESAFIGAINFNMQFDPNQSKTLVLSYKSYVGRYSYRGDTRVNFSYLLSPAKYFVGFEDLTINVYLPKDVNHITSSSLELKKISDLHYQYKADSLPNKDFSIGLYNKSVIGLYNKSVIETNFQDFMQGVVIFIFPLIIIAIAVFTMIKNKKINIMAMLSIPFTVGLIFFNLIYSLNFIYDVEKDIPILVVINIIFTLVTLILIKLENKLKRR